MKAIRRSLGTIRSNEGPKQSSSWVPRKELEKYLRPNMNVRPPMCGWPTNMPICTCGKPLTVCEAQLGDTETETNHG